MLEGRLRAHCQHFLLRNEYSTDLVEKAACIGLRYAVVEAETA
jgi:hypothetical protein